MALSRDPGFAREQNILCGRIVSLRHVREGQVDRLFDVRVEIPLVEAWFGFRGILAGVVEAAKAVRNQFVKGNELFCA